MIKSDECQSLQTSGVLSKQTRGTNENGNNHLKFRDLPKVLKSIASE